LLEACNNSSLTPVHHQLVGHDVPTCLPLLLLLLLLLPGRGVGCVPIHNLMEDAATAEISRSQLWQWVRHRAATAEGRQVTADWVTALLDQETDAFRR
jgi:hypothetical protein